MYRRIVLEPMIVALMLALNAQAQTAPYAEELTKLLKEFLAGASRNDVATHDRFWAEDLIYTGSSSHARRRSQNAGCVGGRKLYLDASRRKAGDEAAIA